MNRRSFVNRALAGLAAIPFLSRLTSAKSQCGCNSPCDGICRASATKAGGWYHNGFRFTREDGLQCFANGKEVFPDEDGFYRIKFERDS